MSWNTRNSSTSSAKPHFLAQRRWRRYPQAMRRRHPQALFLHTFGNPGGGSAGGRRAGIPAVLLDKASSPDIDDAVNYFSAPANRDPLVHVVSGDALEASARDAAVASHPEQSKWLATLATPPCRPTSTANVTGESTVT